MTLQNPVKSSAQSRQAGWLAGALGLGTDAGGGPLATASRALTMIAITGAAVLFGIDQYFDIGLKNQSLEAARFDSQSVLVANHLTPEQAAANLDSGVVINGLDGKPIVGKSLEAFTAYLTAQAKATADIAASKATKFDSQSIISANHLTPEQAAARLAAGEIIKGADGKPIIGKSLETFTTYLASQATAQNNILDVYLKSAEAKADYDKIMQINLDRFNKCTECKNKIRSRTTFLSSSELFTILIENHSGFVFTEEDGKTPLTGKRMMLLMDFLLKK